LLRKILFLGLGILCSCYPPPRAVTIVNSDESQSVDFRLKADDGGWSAEYVLAGGNQQTFKCGGCDKFNIQIEGQSTDQLELYAGNTYSLKISNGKVAVSP
jgi:hypothetical protein